MVMLCLLFWACEAEVDQHSTMFQALFGTEEQVGFRGTQPGDLLEVVREREGSKPRTDDPYGLVYESQLGEGRQATIEYMSRDQDTRIVNAIVINVVLDNEAATTNLYTEIESNLRQDYGVPEGDFGQYDWRDADRNLRINLRMLGDKKSFSLNFAPLIAL